MQMNNYKEWVVNGDLFIISVIQAFLPVVMEEFVTHPKNTLRDDQE